MHAQNESPENPAKNRCLPMARRQLLGSDALRIHAQRPGTSARANGSVSGTVVGAVVEKRVSDVMNKEVVTVSPDMTMPDLQRLFGQKRFGAVPVMDRDRNLKGIVSRSDVVRKFSLEQTLVELADSDFDASLGVEDNDDALESLSAAVGIRLAKVKARDIMITDVATIAPDAPLADAADIMVARRIHRLPVLEDGRLVGIVSAFDFMRLYASANKDSA
jgi:CBS domain-containing protein